MKINMEDVQGETVWIVCNSCEDIRVSRQVEKIKNALFISYKATKTLNNNDILYNKGISAILDMLELESRDTHGPQDDMKFAS